MVDSDENIASENLEGTDIKTEKDLNLSASKDVVVKSSKDEYSSSSSSSSKALNADLTVSTNPKDMLGSVTASQSKGKGNSEGTVNVNSKFEVGGTHKVEAGEKVIYEGANVEAGRVEIKGEEVIIASSKDTEKSSSKNSNSSINVTPGAPGFSGELNIGYRKGNGEKIGDLTGALANSNDEGIFNTYKENRFGNLLNDYIKKSGVLGLLLDNRISSEDKRMALTDLVEGFLNERGYKGPMPEIHIGEKSFAVDSSKGHGAEPSKNGKEIIFISKASLNSRD